MNVSAMDLLRRLGRDLFDVDAALGAEHHHRTLGRTVDQDAEVQLSLDAEVAKSPEGLTIPADIYDTPIEELDLSTRTYNCLKRADITKVGQVLEMDEKALLSVRNLGQKSMEEIRDKLIERGYIPRSSLLSATNGTEPSE